MEKRKSAKRQRLQNETKEKLVNKISFNSLPEEIFIKIFSYLTQNELGQIARVCKKWKELTRSQVLWKKVDVYFNCGYDSQDDIERTVMNSLSACTSRIKLNFRNFFPMYFGHFSRDMKDVCPNLEVLMVYEACLSCNFSSCVSICIKFLKNLRVLCFDTCKFDKSAYEEGINSVSKIEVLSILWSNPKRKPQFSTVPFLKEFHFVWPWNDMFSRWLKDEAFFISNLKILNLSCAFINSDDFRIIQNKAPDLVELYLCYSSIRDVAFNFGDSTNVFPHLEVICIVQKERGALSMEGVISCIKSCPSLRRIYLRDDVWDSEAYAAQPFAKNCKLEVIMVGCSSNCGHSVKRKDYLHE